MHRKHPAIKKSSKCKLRCLSVLCELMIIIICMTLFFIDGQWKFSPGSLYKIICSRIGLNVKLFFLQSLSAARVSRMDALLPIS